MNGHELWVMGKCPILNCVIYYSGRLITLNLDYILKGKGEYKIRPLVESTVDSYLKYNPDYLVSFYTTKALEIISLQETVYIGDGGYEGDALIAVIDSKKDELKWMVFLEGVEEFKDVDFNGNSLIVKDREGYQWIFPINEPEKVDIINI